MVVVMQERATGEQVERVIAQLVEMGFDVHRSTGALRTVIGAVGGKSAAMLKRNARLSRRPMVLPPCANGEVIAATSSRFSSAPVA